MTKLVHLPGRAVVEVSGEDRVAFLQGLVSNDVTMTEGMAAEGMAAEGMGAEGMAAGEGRAVWAALLTPQGKWLADFFIVAARDGNTGRLLLDCERAQTEMLVQRLRRHRLRARVAVEPREMRVYAAWDGVPEAGGLIFPDPRLPEAGWRILAAEPLAANADEAEYDLHRLTLGLPDGSRDLEPEKTVLLEAGFDELNGVSWTKGCYMGQELTARTKYRGLIKRRLVPVEVEGALPAPGTPVLRDGADAGTMRSGRDSVGLAVLRIDALAGPLACGEARLVPRLPAWMRLPETA